MIAAASCKKSELTAMLKKSMTARIFRRLHYTRGKHCQPAFTTKNLITHESQPFPKMKTARQPNKTNNNRCLRRIIGDLIC